MQISTAVNGDDLGFIVCIPFLNVNFGRPPPARDMQSQRPLSRTKILNNNLHLFTRTTAFNASWMYLKSDVEACSIAAFTASCCASLLCEVGSA